jgi:hypothetical protein
VTPRATIDEKPISDARYGALNRFHYENVSGRVPEPAEIAWGELVDRQGDKERNGEYRLDEATLEIRMHYSMIPLDGGDVITAAIVDRRVGRREETWSATGPIDGLCWDDVARGLYTDGYPIEVARAVGRALAVKAREDWDQLKEARRLVLLAWTRQGYE